MQIGFVSHSPGYQGSRAYACSATYLDTARSMEKDCAGKILPETRPPLAAFRSYLEETPSFRVRITHPRFWESQPILSHKIVWLVGIFLLYLLGLTLSFVMTFVPTAESFGIGPERSIPGVSLGGTSFFLCRGGVGGWIGFQCFPRGERRRI